MSWHSLSEKSIYLIMNKIVQEHNTESDTFQISLCSQTHYHWRVSCQRLFSYSCHQRVHKALQCNSNGHKWSGCEGQWRWLCWYFRLEINVVLNWPSSGWKLLFIVEAAVCCMCVVCFYFYFYLMEYFPFVPVVWDWKKWQFLAVRVWVLSLLQLIFCLCFEKFFKGMIQS